jgi:DNA-binding transcriptional LysR family regulator
MTLRRDWGDRIGRRIKLRDLHILLAVAQARSMGKAAADLGVSQPVVSKAISDLEFVLGVRLMDRSAQGVELTVYGSELVKYGNAVFDDLRAGVKALEFLSDPTVGELRVGCTEPLAAGFIAEVIGRLSAKYRRASFHVMTADPMALNERELQHRNVDLVVSPTETIVPDADTTIDVLFDDRQVIVAGPKNKLARRRRLQLHHLEDERWFLPPADSAIGSHIAECFRAAGLQMPRPHVASFSIPLCLRMVERENFLTMLPISMLLYGGHPSLRLLRVEAPSIPRPTGIIALKNRTLGPLARLFSATAREVASVVAKRLRLG